MFFLYFILICIAIGLINWFVIFPLLEKAKTKKFLEVLKNILDFIISFLVAIFVIYVYIATIVTTANLLSEYLKIEQTGILAFIIVSAFVYLAIKKFTEDH